MQVISFHVRLEIVIYTGHMFLAAGIARVDGIIVIKLLRPV